MLKEGAYMWNQLLLIMIGFSAGIIIAGGEVGLLIGLSIIPRYAGITHTGKHILLYEDSILLGTGKSFFPLEMADSWRIALSHSLWSFLRTFPRRLDHGISRSSRHFPYLCKTSQIFRRSAQSDPVHCPGKNLRIFILLL